MISQAMSQRMRILHPCSTPGCGELGAGGSCELHRRRRQREDDDRRGSSTERGYDASHRRLRIVCFERDSWRCVDCDWEPDIIRDCREAGLESPPTAEVLTELRARFARGDRHLHADHEIPIEVRPDLRLDLDNLRTRCDGCHRAKTMRESVPQGPVGGTHSLGVEGSTKAMPIRENSQLFKEILGPTQR